MDASNLPPAREPKDGQPLLPPILLGPAAFLFLWVLPIGIMLLLNLQSYWLIEGDMNPEQRHQAFVLGWCGLVDLLAGVAVWVVVKIQNRTSALRSARFYLWGLAAVAIQTGYLWHAYSASNDILPRSVTAWIYSPEHYLFNQFAFAMLPAFFGILLLACARPSKEIGEAIAVSLGLAFGGPVMLYFLGLVVWSVTAGSQSHIPGIILATGVVALSILMFVGIIRALMLGLRVAQGWRSTGERIAIILFALITPIAGLLLNRFIPFPVDFQAWEVYTLVVANAAILLLASYRRIQRPRLSFYLLCATLPFSLYFFVVFLPYTPLSIVAVLVMGAGFLVLTPTFLFVLHLYLLNQSCRSPQLSEGRWRLAFTGILCSLLLPAYFTLRGLADKAALNAALDYVYTPTVTSGKSVYPGSLVNLRRALASHRSYKNGIYYPFISDYYSWLVFDNLVLPDDKLAGLENIFFGRTGSKESLDPFKRRAGIFAGDRGVRERSHMPLPAALPHTVEVRNLDLSFRPSGTQNSIVTMVLTLQNTGTRAAEYLKTLPLPEGIYVTGFRLHIHGVAVPGRIFEKKTALWVYTMIRDSERRDPGILFYNTPGEVQLQVFPVATTEATTVEIDFLLPTRPGANRMSGHPTDPASVLAELGRLLTPQLARDTQGATFAAGGFGGQTLPPVERQPYLHLIVNRSFDNGYQGDLLTALRILKEKFPAVRRVRITLANYNVIDLVTPLTSIDEVISRPPEELEQALPLSGGLALDLALAHAIRRHTDDDLDRLSNPWQVPPRPIFVLLSQIARKRPIELDLTNSWADLLPGFEIYELGADGTLADLYHPALAETPLLRLGNSVRSLVANRVTTFKAAGENEVLKYWSPDTHNWRPVAGVATQDASTAWSQAASLQLQQQDRARSPGDSSIDPKALIKASRESGILLPIASYIVVENSAQWRILESSEKTKLNQNAALDFLETPAPPSLFVAIGFALWLALRRLRRAGLKGLPFDNRS